MAALTSADLQTMQELLHTKCCQRALRIAQAAQQAIEIEVQHLLACMEEEELAMEALEDQVTNARSRWQTAAIQVLTVKNILTSQGIAPPKTEHKSSATFVQLLAECAARTRMMKMRGRRMTTTMEAPRPMVLPCPRYKGVLI
jgi:hypothetical protein